MIWLGLALLAWLWAGSEVLFGDVTWAERWAWWRWWRWPRLAWLLVAWPWYWWRWRLR